MYERAKRTLLTPSGLAIAAFAVAVLVAGLLWIRPYFTAPRTFIASVAAPVGLQADQEFQLNPGGSACMNGVALPRSLGQVSFDAYPVGGREGPPLVLRATAPGYEATAALNGGYGGGNAVLALRPPSRSEIGTVCITDIGRLPAAVRGNNEPRGVTRSELTIDGRPTPGNLAITFLTPGSHPLADRLLPTAQHASRLIDEVFSPYLLLVLGALILFGLPALIGAVLWWACLSGSASRPTS